MPTDIMGKPVAGSPSEVNEIDSRNLCFRFRFADGNLTFQGSIAWMIMITNRQSERKQFRNPVLLALASSTRRSISRKGNSVAWTGRSARKAPRRAKFGMFLRLADFAF